jgi:hypothetical protein
LLCGFGAGLEASGCEDAGPGVEAVLARGFSVVACFDGGAGIAWGAGFGAAAFCPGGVALMLGKWFAGGVAGA